MSKESDPRIVYADIIDLPHWQSPSRPPMSRSGRAAQFLSYKALTGFEQMIAEEARVTDEMTEIGRDDLEFLNQQLNRIAAAVSDGEHPLVSFTVFVRDEKKEGGRLEEITDAVRKVDTVYHKVVLMSPEGNGNQNRSIPFESIVSVRGYLWD